MTDSAGAVFVALTQEGAALARRLAAAVPGSQLHGLDGRVRESDVPFASVGDHLRALYCAGHPVVGVFSTAIMIRALAGSLADKAAAAPVLCVAGDGSAVVPLLGGHHGANALAARLAKALGIAPAITTAGEARFGLALDEPPPGWAVSGTAAAKPVMADLLAGRAVRLVSELDSRIDAGWIAGSGAPFTDAAAPRTVRLTERAPPDCADELCLHPRTLVLGVGCERGVAADELSDLVNGAFAARGWSRHAVACVATIELKEDEAAIRALADALGVQLRLFSAALLEQETPRLASPSDAVFRAVGCHGVAEAAALACAGPEADLVVPKTRSARATCAVARAPAIVAPEAAGRAPGLLSVVGLGPGHSLWRAPEATDALARAEDIVGYGRYLDLIGDLARGKTLHRYALGEERDRCACALELAAQGRRVALVCSGDAGIYAMASLVFELIDSAGNAAWRRLAVAVIPGISALQALAARSGAPLGHDFCAVSLSDLMTPWPMIENRLRAAAAGDFVVALYNPVSRRRTGQLAVARDILLEARSPDTPVALGRNLGRAGERVEITTLGALDPAGLDMLTTVLVGSSATRRIDGCGGTARIYTPRGYAGGDGGDGPS